MDFVGRLSIAAGIATIDNDGRFVNGRYRNLPTIPGGRWVFYSLQKRQE
jgi:hypothetical protein